VVGYYKKCCEIVEAFVVS